MDMCWRSQLAYDPVQAITPRLMTQLASVGCGDNRNTIHVGNESSEDFLAATHALSDVSSADQRGWGFVSDRIREEEQPKVSLRPFLRGFPLPGPHRYRPGHWVTAHICSVRITSCVIWIALTPAAPLPTAPQLERRHPNRLWRLTAARGALSLDKHWTLLSLSLDLSRSHHTEQSKVGFQCSQYAVRIPYCDIPFTLFPCHLCGCERC